jgi:hypothetical protein
MCCYESEGFVSVSLANHAVDFAKISRSALVRRLKLLLPARQLSTGSNEIGDLLAKFSAVRDSSC